jgi:hypothetical protein
MLTCKETSELISAQYDRRLGLRERLSMRLHLSMCRYCQAVARQIALIQRLVGLPGGSVWTAGSGACLSAEGRERITAALVDANPSKDTGMTAN